MPLRPDVNLQPHQQRVVAGAQTAAASGEPFKSLLYWSPGSGKSLAAIGAAEALGGPYSAVVPAALRTNYHNELKKFTDQTTPVDVLSYNQLGRGRQPLYPQTVVFDEFHRARSSDSAQAAAARELAAKARNTILLTGTPVTNSPGDLVAVLHALTGKQIAPDEFVGRYAGTEKSRAGGVLGRLWGSPVQETPSVAHADELRALLAGKVDYHQTTKPPEGYPASVTHTEVPVELHPHQADLIRAMYDKLPWLMRMKLRYNYPLSDDELVRARSFLTGPRQAALSVYPFQAAKDPLAAFNTSAKLVAAYNATKAKLDANPAAKAIFFSSFPSAMLDPLAAKLQQDNIPFGVFHGGLSDQERKEMVELFNNNQTRVALLSPAASEGLSLRGVQTINLLDGHFHNARGEQAQARGIRFDSHLGLPPDLRDVEVRRYIAKLPLTWKEKLLASSGVLNREEARRTVDDYLKNLSAQKDRKNSVFLDLLREVAQENARKAPGEKRASFADRWRLVKLAALVPQAQQQPSVLDKLKAAKRFSDQGDYASKTAILRELMQADPASWTVDSVLYGRYAGVTHATGFRLHVPVEAIADLAPKFSPSAANPFAPQPSAALAG